MTTFGARCWKDAMSLRQRGPPCSRIISLAFLPLFANRLGMLCKAEHARVWRLVKRWRFPMSFFSKQMRYEWHIFEIAPKLLELLGNESGSLCFIQINASSEAIREHLSRDTQQALTQLVQAVAARKRLTGFAFRGPSGPFAYSVRCALNFEDLVHLDVDFGKSTLYVDIIVANLRRVQILAFPVVNKVEWMKFLLILADETRLPRLQRLRAAFCFNISPAEVCADLKPIQRLPTLVSLNLAQTELAEFLCAELDVDCGLDSVCMRHLGIPREKIEFNDDELSFLPQMAALAALTGIAKIEHTLHELFAGRQWPPYRWFVRNSWGAINALGSTPRNVPRMKEVLGLFTRLLPSPDDIVDVLDVCVEIFCFILALREHEPAEYAIPLLTWEGLIKQAFEVDFPVSSRRLEVIRERELLTALDYIWSDRLWADRIELDTAGLYSGSPLWRIALVHFKGLYGDHRVSRLVDKDILDPAIVDGTTGMDLFETIISLRPWLVGLLPSILSHFKRNQSRERFEGAVVRVVRHLGTLEPQIGANLAEKPLLAEILRDTVSAAGLVTLEIKLARNLRICCLVHLCVTFRTESINAHERKRLDESLKFLAESSVFRSVDWPQSDQGFKDAASRVLPETLKAMNNFQPTVAYVLNFARKDFCASM